MTSTFNANISGENFELPKIHHSHFQNIIPNFQDIHIVYTTKKTEKEKTQENDVYNLVQCVYENNFKPVYAQNLCSCRNCFDKALLNKTYVTSSQLNKFVIWNDIIKRWEGYVSIKDTQNTLSSQEIKNQTRTYEQQSFYEIYGDNKFRTNISVMKYAGYCENCAPKYTTPYGIYSYKMYKTDSQIINSGPCLLCQYFEPKLVIRALSLQTYQMEPISEHIYPRHEQVFVLKDVIDFSPIFDVCMRIPNNYFDYLFVCGNNVYKLPSATDFSSQHNFTISNDKQFIILTQTLNYGTYAGNFSLTFTNIENNTDTITCNYQWNITFIESEQ